MFKGKYIDTYLDCKKGGTKAVHIVLNVPESIFNNNDIASKFADWVRKIGLVKKHYEEERLDKEIFKEEKFDEDYFKIELIAFLDSQKETVVKQEIDDFLVTELKLSPENIYVSDISSKLIIDSSPYLMTSSKTKVKDLLLPIYSKKHFVRSLNDLILDFGFDMVGKYSRYYYYNGYSYLGDEYLDKCVELGLVANAVSDDKNKRIISALFKSCYSAEVVHIGRYEVEGKSLIKLQVKDNFFLYHPTCESRLDVHNQLLSPAISLKVRNCALMRDIFTGFFEKVFCGSMHETSDVIDLDNKRYCGFEYDYTDEGQRLLDFESSKWRPVSSTNKIDFFHFRNKAEENPDIRIECCKAVNMMGRYKVLINRDTIMPIPWNEGNSEDSNILTLDYLSFTQNRMGEQSVKDALGFIKRVDPAYYAFKSKFNKIFYDYFFSEQSETPTNSDLVKREEPPSEDYCTFYIYDKEFFTMGG